MSGTRGESEYAALVAAYANSTPLCLGDLRFTLDEEDIDPSDLADMKRTCRECPLAQACAAFSLAAQPKGGMWCGRFHRASQGRTPKGKTA